MGNIQTPFSAYSGENPYIFVSYAHVNNDIVFPLIKQLHDKGYRIWYDEGIDPGTEFAKVIAEHLKKAAMMLLFVTPEAVERPFVRREINFAQNKGIPIVSVILTETILPDELEMQLGLEQITFYYKYTDKVAFYKALFRSTHLKKCLEAHEETPPVKITRLEKKQDISAYQEPRFIDDYPSSVDAVKGTHPEKRQYAPVYEEPPFIDHPPSTAGGSGFFSTKKLPERYVFFGGGEPAQLLAKDVLRKKTATCTFYLDKKLDDDKRLFDELDGMGATVIYTNLDDVKAYQSCVKKNRIFRFRYSYFFLDDNDDSNVRIAMSILTVLKSLPCHQETHLYIRTETEGVLFDTRSFPHIELHIFSQSDLIARKFVTEHPMLECPNIAIDHANLRVKDAFSLLLVGFGLTGRDLLNKCICNAQFVGSTFSASIIDLNYESQQNLYPVLFDECVREYNLHFVNSDEVCDVNTVAFYKWLSNHLVGFNRVIVALGDDKVNIELAGKITRLLLEDGKSMEFCRSLVFVHIHQGTKYGYYYEKENIRNIPFTVFGNIETIYKQNVVINESGDKIAKMVNFVFCQFHIKLLDNINLKEANELWKRIVPPFIKNSIRSMAQNLGNIMRIAGGEENLARLIKAECEGNALAKQKLEILAESEHLRWNAFLLTNGVRCWPVDEITTTNGKLVDASGTIIKHGCLVPFSRLDAIAAKVNAIRQQKGQQNMVDYIEPCRSLIRHFPLFIRESKRNEP